MTMLELAPEMELAQYGASSFAKEPELDPYPTKVQNPGVDPEQLQYSLINERGIGEEEVVAVARPLQPGT